MGATCTGIDFTAVLHSKNHVNTFFDVLIEKVAFQDCFEWKDDAIINWNFEL